MNVDEQNCCNMILAVYVLFSHFNKECMYAINCSDVQSVQISSTTCKTTDVRRTTSCNRTTRCNGCDDFERQDFCRLP